jgi:hypothetical protein
MLPLLELICIPSHWPGTGLPSISSRVSLALNSSSYLAAGVHARLLYAKDCLIEASTGKLLCGLGCVNLAFIPAPMANPYEYHALDCGKGGLLHD